MEIVLKLVLVVFLVLFVVLFIFSLVVLAIHHKTGGALFVPTPKVMIRELIRSIDFSSFHDIRELGCGDGRFIRAVEQGYGVTVTGYEINPLAFMVSYLMLWNRRSRVLFRSFWEEDLSGVDCIYCYLFPDLMERLGEKLGRELPEGARVISSNFPIPLWQEDRIIKAQDTIFDDPIYVYVKGRHLPNG